MDFALMAAVEKVLARDAEMMASMARVDPREFQWRLAELVERHVAIIDAATEAHEAITASLVAS